MTLPLVLRPRAGADVDLAVFGENSLDIVARVAPGSSVAGKRRLAAFERRVGGQGVTAAIGCARQGLRVRYAGVLGGDASAELVREALRRERVELATIERPGVPTRVAVVVVDPDGDRCVYEYRHPDLTLEDAGECSVSVTGARLVLVDATDLPASIAVARAARAAGARTIVDVDQVDPRTADLLAEIDVIVVPEEFVTAFTGTPGTGAGLRALAGAFRTALVVATRGGGGSVALCGGHEIVTPAVDVDVVDTTGAGDAFRAGLCAAWLLADGAPDVEWLLRWANATAGLNCRALGAQAGLPDRAAVEALVTPGRPGRSK